MRIPREGGQEEKNVGGRIAIVPGALRRKEEETGVRVEKREGAGRGEGRDREEEERRKREKDGAVCVNKNTGRKYQEEKIIGRGAFGVAVLCKTDDGNRVVIKHVAIDQLGRVEKAAAVREAEMLSKLGCHPYVVRYREAFIKQNNLCIVMDYYQGGELRLKIENHRTHSLRFPEKRIRIWLAQIVLALKFLHNQNIVHRDLKPANILVGEFDRLRLADLGLTTALRDDLLKTVTCCGTPCYMAPEVYKSQPYDGCADVWSLGVIAFELCMLQLPFNGESQMAIMNQVLHKQPSAISDEYSPFLRRLINCMLDKDPTKRITINQLVDQPYMQAAFVDLRDAHDRSKKKAAAAAAAASGGSS